jgi:hypothetical protein
LFTEKRERALGLCKQDRLDIGRQVTSEQEERIFDRAERLRQVSYELLRGRDDTSLDATQEGRIDAKLAGEPLHGHLALLPKLVKAGAERG